MKYEDITIKKEMLKEISRQRRKNKIVPTHKDIGRFEKIMKPKGFMIVLQNVQNKQGGIFCKKDLIKEKETYKMDIEREFNFLKKFNCFAEVPEAEAKKIIIEHIGKHLYDNRNKYFRMSKDFEKLVPLGNDFIQENLKTFKKFNQ